MIREFQVAAWRARPELHQLDGAAGPVTVEAHSMEVLIALAEQAGEVVSREQLLDRVWGELFVGEHVLTHAIWDLRQALGDDPKRPRFIQTVPKRGYRLIAPVSWLEQGVGETGRYRLHERIGGGAMGIVFRGEDTRLGRAVALKFLPPEWSRDEVAKTRFLREAKVAAALDHPNLCTLYEIDETDDGRLFLVMPFYEGETLRQSLARAPLAPGSAVEVGEQIASGLDALHQAEIVHRDIKPGNIFLTTSGEVKILDFGLAKFAGSTRLTQIGSSPGTPAYMSPERVRGEEATPAADVWALGVLLYRALSGRHPFGAESEDATFFAILNSEPTPLAELGIDGGISEVVSRALAKNPDERFESAAALRAALRQVANPPGQAEARSAPRQAGGAAGNSAPAAGGIDVTGQGPVGLVDASEGAPRTAAAKKRRRRAALWIALAAAAAAATIVVLWKQQGGGVNERPAAATSELDRARIVVLPFANRTGDDELDRIGLMAASHAGNALARTGRVTVVPLSETRQAVGGAERSAGEIEVLASRVGAATGAGLAVIGSIYSTGGELRLHADVLDLVKNQLVWSLEPASVERSEPEPALLEVEQILMSVVAMYVDRPELPPVLFSHMPTFEVYQEYWAGVSVPSAADSDIAREHLLRAWELDPEFLPAGLYLAGAPLKLLGNKYVREGLEELDTRREQLTPFERHLHDAFLNQIRGRWQDALLQLRAAERLAPESAWINTQISNTALWLNRPREALAVMDKIPVVAIRDPFAHWRRIVNRGYALHALGRYEEELEFARKALELLPNLPTEPRYAQVRALAAMARLDELEQVLVTSRADVHPIWEEDAWYLLASALQLRAHGHPVQARGYAERAVQWYRDNVDRERDERLDDPRTLSWSLWLLGRFDEAYENHLRIAAENPRSVVLKAEIACLAALRGEREEALRLLDEVTATERPDHPGIILALRGWIHAHLGELDRAVELLAQGFGEGDNYKEYRVHYHVFLSPLLGYPPYEELVRPRG